MKDKGSSKAGSPVTVCGACWFQPMANASSILLSESEKVLLETA
jgi:hypothetical protein